MTRTIGITLGEPCGIGPELVIRSLAKGPPADARIVVYGSPALLEATASGLGIEPFWGESSQAAVRIVPCGPNPKGGRFDTDDLRARAEATLAALDAGSADALAHRTHALVTAPIDKSVVRRLVPGFTGHTRYLAEKAGVERTIMLLDNTEIRVVLVTEHIPLREVPARVTQEEVEITVRTAAEAFRKWFGKRKLRVAVAGLNPHAGEIVERSEEEVVLAPAIHDLNGPDLSVEGPFAADSIFSLARHGGWDFVVSPCHDQGLVAAKYPGLDKVVNVTLGLPYLRVSPGHGVAYDLVGSGKADLRSFWRAIRVALTGRLEGA